MTPDEILAKLNADILTDIQQMVRFTAMSLIIGKVIIITMLISIYNKMKE